MDKRVGQIQVSGYGWWQFDVHHNDSVKESITVKNQEALRDLQYAVNAAVREMEEREKQTR
jgi:hypothetical protein